MKNYKYHYLPANLNATSITTTLPNVKQDQVYYIISKLFEQCVQKEGQLINGLNYVNICSKPLQKRVREYNKVIDALKICGVITTTPYFNGGTLHGKCAAFAFAPKYVTTVVSVPLKDDRFKHSLIKHSTKDQTNREPCHYLDKWFKQVHLDFDLKKAKSMLNHIMNSSSTISPSNASSLSITFERLARQDFNLGRDKTSGRYHSPITRLNKTFRSCIKLQNRKQLIQIDIVNCQPYLMQVIIDKTFINSKINKLRYFKTSYKHNIEELSKALTSIILVKTPESVGISDLQRFIDSVNGGRFYEDFMLDAKTSCNVILTRKEAKKAMFSVLYSSNKWRGRRPNYPKLDATLKELFIQLYPSIYDFMEMVKAKQKNALAILMQNIESYLIIDVCCKRISSEQPTYPIYTVHDSIVTTEENVDFVSQIMVEEFTRFVGFKPRLKNTSLA